MSALLPQYRATWETDAHRDLRKHAAEFLRKECTPNQERWAQKHAVDREFWHKLGDAVHSPIAAHYLNTYANEDQKRRWMPGVVSGQKVLATAMTEPEAGSDLQAIKTTARHDGGHHVVNGSKTFMSNGTHCDLLLIVAKTGKEQGAKGISLIVAETDEHLQDFQRGRVLDKVGQHRQGHPRIVLLRHACPGTQPARARVRPRLLSANEPTHQGAAHHRVIVRGHGRSCPARSDSRRAPDQDDPRTAGQ
jgi:acyl-CoA dehydrogenase